MIKLGVIGLSEGNGHPYSWSAIINGYSKVHMLECGFPVIPEYLAARTWPDARIADAQVTHVWTQSAELSRKVALASLIPNIVNDPAHMVGNVDAILLARDDAENHYDFAKLFIEAGLPIYIDKPIATSRSALEQLYSLEQYEGQIFTCSALRYAKELTLDRKNLESIGEIRHIQATTPKSWAKYSPHIIEPVLNFLDENIEIVDLVADSIGSHGRQLVSRFSNGVTASFSALGEDIACPLAIRVHGEQGWKDLFFSDSFSAFKCALQDFLDGIRTNSCRSPRKFNEQVVTLIEAGLLK